MARASPDAAFGMVARALGWNQKVGIVQYIKGKWITGERQFFQEGSPTRSATRSWARASPGTPRTAPATSRPPRPAWAISLEMLNDPDLDLVVLDELNIALRYDYLDIAKVVADLQARPATSTWCITGRNAKPELLAIADLVTEMTLVKHPLRTGHQGPARDRLLSWRITRRSALAAGAAVGLGGRRPAEPRRVVSLNPCLDVILVHVADRAQVAAISHYSHNMSSSSIGPAALSYPFTYESAEEVLALRPDLVLDRPPLLARHPRGPEAPGHPRRAASGCPTPPRRAWSRSARSPPPSTARPAAKPWSPGSRPPSPPPPRRPEPRS